MREDGGIFGYLNEQIILSLVTSGGVDGDMETQAHEVFYIIEEHVGVMIMGRMKMSTTIPNEGERYSWEASKCV